MIKNSYHLSWRQVLYRLWFEKLKNRLHSERHLLFIIVLATLSTFINLHFQSYSRYTHHIFRPPHFQYWIDRYVRTTQDIDPRGLVSGIFLGREDRIEPSTYSIFRVTGILHLIAASGFNCWIVAKVFSILASIILYVLWFRLKTKTLLFLRSILLPITSISGAWCFYFWSDQSPPITRATLLISSKYFLELLGIRPEPFRFLFVHYLLFLIVDPRLMQSPSFQLSFFCLYGVFAIQKVIPFKQIQTTPFLMLILESAVTSLGACLGALPITFIFFQEINFTGVLTNFFAVPMTSLWIMPNALLGMLFLPFSSMFSRCFVHLATFGTEALLWCLHVFLKLHCILRL